MSEKKLGRYQQKARQGLVPFRYDREGRSFKAGAWKNWETLGYQPTSPNYQHQVASIVSRDAEALRIARNA